jgi:hypothetical protein
VDYGVVYSFPKWAVFAYLPDTLADGTMAKFGVGTGLRVPPQQTPFLSFAAAGGPVLSAAQHTGEGMSVWASVCFFIDDSV